MQWLATARKDRCQEAVAESADHYQVADHQRTLLVGGGAHQEEELQLEDYHHQEEDRHLEDQGNSVEGVCFPTVSCIKVSS